MSRLQVPHRNESIMFWTGLPRQEDQIFTFRRFCMAETPTQDIWRSGRWCWSVWRSFVEIFVCSSGCLWGISSSHLSMFSMASKSPVKPPEPWKAPTSISSSESHLMAVDIDWWRISLNMFLNVFDDPANLRIEHSSKTQPPKAPALDAVFTYSLRT